MARLWDDSSSNYLSDSGAAALTGLPITLSCWFNTDQASAHTGSIMGLHDASNAFQIALVQSGTNLQAIHEDDSFPKSAFQGTVSADTWHHGAGVFPDGDSRKAWLDGTGTNETTTGATLSGLDTTAIGIRYYFGGIDTPFDGEIAEAGIWDVVLSDDEIASLAAGASPLMVRPMSLVAYWPLHAGSGAGAERDWVGTFDLSETGTVGTGAHPPRIVYPYHQTEVRLAAFLEPDWVGENSVAEFGSMIKAEHPN